MITFFHFVRLAIHNLRRGGQRVLVALLCITFGITTLVAMTMIATSIEKTFRVRPAELLGGDLSMVRETEATIRAEDIDQLQVLQQSGEISSYTLIAYNNSSLTFRAAEPGEMHFVGLGMGIEPDKYPLAGSLTVREPGNTGLPTLLQQIGDTVITRDIAEEYNLKLGDPIILSDLRNGIPLTGIVRGIAYDTPNHQGSKIYYSIETAQRLLNGEPVLNTVIVNTNRAQTVSAVLENTGWSVDWAAGRRSETTGNMWVIGLEGAGILGLLVGGIGIANTMQVLLRRRQREIAIWKTLGYRSGDLRLIFILEAGLLGLTGSLLGALLGILTSGQVLDLFRRTSSVLYEWTFSPTPPLMGIIIGTLTTVIFASWAIVIFSKSRPMALLRNEPVDVQRRSGCQSAAMGLLLMIPFTALTSLIMKSVLGGIAVLILIAIGFASLGVFFTGVLWIFTRFLPLRQFPLVRMAFNSLRRRGVALVFAMIALFIGVLSMSVALAVTQVSALKTSIGAFSFQGYNLTIMAMPDQESIIRQAVESENPVRLGVGYRTALNRLSVVGENVPISAMDDVLVGRSDPDDYTISGASWGSQTDGVYAYEGANLAAGSQIEVTLRDGTTQTFNVVGSYDLNYDSINLDPPLGLLMTTEAFKRVAQPDSLSYFVEFDPDQVSGAITALGTTLPQSTIVNLASYVSRFMQSYQKMFVLPMALSVVALMAGFLLVANSVGLAMLDRRYEVGILKTVGYSRRQILSIFLIEYGLVGLLATGAGVIIVQALLAALAISQEVSVTILMLNPSSLTLIGFGGIGLTLLTVLAVTWNSSSIPPVVVLNERN